MKNKINVSTTANCKDSDQTAPNQQFLGTCQSVKSVVVFFLFVFFFFLSSFLVNMDFTAL